MDFSILATVNATLNALGAICLVTGFVFIRRGNVPAHRRAMITAFVLGVLFLVSYLTYHFQVGSVRFQGTGAIRKVYLAVLISHTALAATVPFLATITLVRALRQMYEAGQRTGLSLTQEGRDVLARLGI